MENLRSNIGKLIEVELSGDKKYIGTLVDYGLDILVLKTIDNYMYLPLIHVHFIKPILNNSIYEFNNPSDSSNTSFTNPILLEESISYRKILNNAKGIFLEISVAGNQTIFGYITNILTNYFVFYSPVYKTLYIPLLHLKWLIPFSDNQSPYSIKSFQVFSPDIPLTRTFEELIKKMEGKIVVFDLGFHPYKTGLLKKVENNIAQLVTGNELHIHCNLTHIKTIHCP